MINSTQSSLFARTSLFVRANGLFETLSPQTCLSCEAVGGIFCPSCSHSLARVRSVAGRVQVNASTESGSGLGLESIPAFAGAIYAETVRDALVGLKRTGSRRLYELLVPIVAEAVLLAIDCVNPRRPVAFVPISSGIKTRRGFGGNLVRSLLVDSLRRLACDDRLPDNRRIEVHDHLQSRRVKGSQKWQSVHDRERNVHGALRATQVGTTCAIASHILFDDVVTTGSTVAEAARALAQVGIWTDVVACAAARPRALGLQSTR